MVGGGRFSVELVEMRESYPGHHGHQKEKKNRTCWVLALFQFVCLVMT